jgi:hypothetical protein
MSAGAESSGLVEHLRRGWWIGVVGVLVASGMLAGCGKGSPNTTETTAPTLSWSVLNQETKQRQEVQGDGTMTAGPNDKYFVVFKANDEGGVKTLSLGGAAVWSCSKGGIGQKKTADYVTQSQTFHPDSNGQVDQYVFLSRTVSTGWGCQSGYQFGGGSANLQGSASNYAGKQAQATLKIVRSG